MDSRRAAPPRRKALRLVLLAAFTFLVGLELLLQIGAFAMVALAERRGADAADPHVLCVGDSFTYGVGASSAEGSYPAALQNELKAQGRDIKVINGGWPGRTSRDLLENFSNQLTDNTKVLCILIGANDSWLHPDQVTDEELQRFTKSAQQPGISFRWQWRTARLVSLLFGFESGTWLQSGAAPESGLQSAGDPAKATAGNATPQNEARRARLHESYRLLLADGFSWQAPVIEASDPPAREPRQEYRKRMQSRDYDGARSLIEKALEQHPDSPALLEAFIDVQCKTNQPFGDALTRLQTIHERAPSGLTAERLIQAYTNAGKPLRVIPLAEARIEAEPRSLTAWSCLQLAAFRLGKWDVFERAAPQAIELMAARNAGSAAWIVCNLARHTSHSDSARAARLCVAAFLMSPQIAPVRLTMEKSKARISKADFHKALAAATMDEQSRTEFDELVAQIYDGKSTGAWKSVMTAHLKTLGELADRSGTKVVILEYPFPQLAVREQQHLAADEIGAVVAPIGAAFDEQLKTRDRTDLFVEDGHCNDAGYALIARTVAPLVIKALAE